MARKKVESGMLGLQSHRVKAQPCSIPRDLNHEMPEAQGLPNPEERRSSAQADTSQSGRGASLVH